VSFSIKSGVSRQIFHEVTNIKFYGNPSSGTHVDTRGQTDGQLWRGYWALLATYAKSALKKRRDYARQVPGQFRLLTSPSSLRILISVTQLRIGNNRKRPKTLLTAHFNSKSNLRSRVSGQHLVAETRTKLTQHNIPNNQNPSTSSQNITSSQCFQGSCSRGLTQYKLWTATRNQT
jgi:hypothetical protein